MRDRLVGGSVYLLGTLAAAVLLSVPVALLVCSVLRASVGWGGVHA